MDELNGLYYGIRTSQQIIIWFTDKDIEIIVHKYLDIHSVEQNVIHS